MRVVEGQGIVDDYFRDTFKPTAKVIEKNAAFFAGLADVGRIVVMGHSVSEVDHPYFEKVIASIDVSQVRWKVSYYGDFDGLRRRMVSLGVQAHLTEYALLNAF